jgi:hypothetical protein
MLQIFRVTIYYIDQVKAIYYSSGQFVLSVNWLLDSISAYELQPLKQYYLYQDQLCDVELSSQHSPGF